MHKVKYFQQNTFYSCGPACLRMILSSFDIEITEEKLIELCDTTLFGTTCSQIREAAIELGCNAEAFKELLKNDILKFMKKKIPIIALIDASELYGGAPTGHFIVILDIRENSITYHDPAMGKNLAIDINIFICAWEKYNFRGVKIWK